MNLIRRKPRAELAPWSALREIEDHFSHFFNEPFTGLGEWAPSDRNWAPAIDVTETDAAYVIEADIPGVAKEDLSLEILDNVVTIKGEKKSEKKEDKKGVHRLERAYGSFQRSVQIPGGIQTDAVEAKFEDGVLHVTLPKPEESKPKVVTVKPN